MKIRVKSREVNLNLPLPLGVVPLAVRLMPSKAFEEMRSQVAEPYNQLITRKLFCLLTKEVLETLKPWKGLEIVHVKTKDGTYVSIIL